MDLRTIPVGVVVIAICVNHPKQLLSVPTIPLHIDSDGLYIIQADGSMKKSQYELSCNGGLCKSCIFRSKDYSCKENVIKYITNDLKELADIYPEYFI